MPINRLRKNVKNGQIVRGYILKLWAGYTVSLSPKNMWAQRVENGIPFFKEYKKKKKLYRFLEYFRPSPAKKLHIFCCVVDMIVVVGAFDADTTFAFVCWRFEEMPVC